MLKYWLATFFVWGTIFSAGERAPGYIQDSLVLSLGFLTFLTGITCVIRRNKWHSMNKTAQGRGWCLSSCLFSSLSSTWVPSLHLLLSGSFTLLVTELPFLRFSSRWLWELHLVRVNFLKHKPINISWAGDQTRFRPLLGIGPSIHHLHSWYLKFCICKTGLMLFFAQC